MSDVSTAKSVFALAVVVGCFTVLWPKIFYPMMLAAFRLTTASSAVEDDDDELPPRSAHYHPSMGQSMPKKPEAVERRPGRPSMPRHPGQTYPQPTPSSQGGIMGMIMPVYSVAVILFFFYTVFKVMSKEPDKTPKIKNFNMDPEHRKFVFSEEYDGDVNLKKQASKLSTDAIPEEGEDSSDDYRNRELIKLQKRLADTEAAMAKILQQMGDASQKLSATVPPELKGPLLRNKNFPVINENEKASNSATIPTINESLNLPSMMEPEKREGLRKRTATDRATLPATEGVQKESKEQSTLKTELKLDKPFEKHQCKDSTPDIESYEVVSNAKDPVITHPTAEESIEDGAESDISVEEHSEDSNKNSRDEGSLGPDEEVDTNEKQPNSHKLLDGIVNSNSSFECISSNDNTPLSPDIDINYEVLKKEFECIKNLKTDENAIKDEE